MTDKVRNEHLKPKTNLEKMEAVFNGYNYKQRKLRRILGTAITALYIEYPFTAVTLDGVEGLFEVSAGKEELVEKFQDISDALDENQYSAKTDWRKEIECVISLLLSADVYETEYIRKYEAAQVNSVSHYDIFR